MKTLSTPWSDRVLVVRSDDVVDFASFFADQELATVSAFKLESRRREWLLSRMVAKRLAMQLDLANDPRRISIERPFVIIDGVTSGWRVSLSHSASYAAAAFARAPVGIDVQQTRTLDERAAHLFLSPEETGEMESCTVPERILHFWCAKEAAFKQRSEEFVTLRQVPLRLLNERAGSLLFDTVETLAQDAAIVAVTRPTF